jgi:streptogramin lyase
MKTVRLFALIASLTLSGISAWGESVKGVVKDASGSPLRGVMISAIDLALEKSVSVLSAADGTFAIDGLASKAYDIRARFISLEDNTLPGITAGTSHAVSLAFSMEPAVDINLQRPADNLLGLLKFDSIADKENFKMFCTYCHQVGTLGFRSPEEPIDWNTMVTRMDGFGGLFKHTQDSIVGRLLAAYSDAAIENWPPYAGPPDPEDVVLSSRITEWDLGRQDNSTVHDIELGPDGKIYAVDMSNDSVLVLDPITGERTEHIIPGGIQEDASNTRRGPHSIEADAKGDMWLTLALSGEMAKFDITTKEFTIMSGAPSPATRGRYPHTLRVDKKGYIWFTDAGRQVCRLSPNPPYEVKEYKLPSADQAVGGGRGEARGRTPYGIDVAPDGKIWYTKLNGNRVGRIDPDVEDGDIKEWNPPFRGPRRLHVAPDGIVWVPGWGSGVIGRFDPETEEWRVYEMPNTINRLPYAVNIHPQTGKIWVCGTGSDTLIVLDPETGHFTPYRMPSRVTFTREIEIDDDGNIWTCNSNGPIRHSERGKGSIIKLETNL